jgi:hypothetical protein
MKPLQAYLYSKASKAALLQDYKVRIIHEPLYFPVIFAVPLAFSLTGSFQKWGH